MVQCQLHLTGVGLRNLLPPLPQLIDPTADFLVGQSITFQYDTVTDGQGAAQFDRQPLAALSHYLPQQYPPLATAIARHQPLVIAALEPTRRQATRKAQFQFPSLLRVQRLGLTAERGIDRAAVLLAYVGHILWRFQAALDLQGHTPAWTSCGTRS